MKTRKFLIIAIFFCLISSNSLFAQFNDYGIKGGIQGFGLLPDTDFRNDDIKISFLGRAVVRFNLTNLLDLELGAGYGILAGDDPVNDYWKTRIIPADLRFLISPFNSKLVNPYIYGGIGYLKWDIQDKPVYLTPAPTKENGGDLFAPFGGGFEVKLSNSLLLDLSSGYSFTFTDDLNYYNNKDSRTKGANDGYWAFGLGIIYVGENGSSDVDADGLTRDQELELGTNPDIADSDNDGINDGLEINQYNTDPLKKDSDNDGINDKAELKEYGTNPNSKDSDKDSLSDGDEIKKYNTAPLRSDSDFDGLSDDSELFVTKTNPLKSDTDNDGLNDGEEVERFKTSPIKPDTDEDGLSDGEEVLQHNTNPLKKDTDGGGESDKKEIDQNTNPLNPEDDIVLDITTPIVLDGVTFATNSAELTPESEKMLMKVLNTLNAYPDIKVEIRGYTDNVGNASSNLQLSQRRANAVRYWIIAKGIAPNRVTARGYGEQDPIADNNTKEGRRLNRRIEFVKIN